MSDEMTYPKFDRYACAGDTLRWEQDGFDMMAEIKPDEHHEPPWKSSDGHGPVSDWMPHSYVHKKDRDWIVSQDYDSVRLYDHEEALRIALRDGWGPRQPVEGESVQDRALRAVREDFEHLKRWCDDEWFYGCLEVSAWKEDIKFGYATIGGIDVNSGDNNDWLSSYLEDLASEAIADARATLIKLGVPA